MQSMIKIEDLCKKLRPIFGSKIDRLYLQYTLADSLEKRLEIERIVNALFQRYINSSMLTEKILLEPPEKETIKGDYPLALVSYSDKGLYPFSLREQDWIRHVCVTGMSGSGKTNFAFQVLGNMIIKKKAFIVFDWKKSFRPLIKIDKNIMLFTIGNNDISNLFKFNINKPPKKVDPKEWLNFLCDLISECFDTSFGVHKILVNVIDKAFKDFGVYEGSGNYPTWLQIKDRLENMNVERGRESEWLTSAQRIAHVLTFGSFGESINYKGFDSMSIEELFSKRVIFELDSLSTIEKKFFCEFILGYIYKYMKKNSKTIEDFKYAILVDEAHNIFLKERPNFVKESVTDVIYREIREYGVSLICLDQHISKLSDVVAGNSATNIAFQQILPQDVEVVSGLMALKDHKNFFSMLAVGEAIVKVAERFHTPFTVKVPFINSKAKSVEDNEIKGLMKNYIIKYRKIKMFKEDARTDKLKKEIEDFKKMQYIFRQSGVDISSEAALKQANIKRAMDKAYEKKTTIINHIQEKIYNESKELLKTFKDVSAIKKYMFSQGFKLNDINRALNRLVEDTKDKEEYRYELSNDEKKFLKFVYSNPDKSISQLYSALKLSARKGNYLKNKLLSNGMIKINELRNDKGWKKTVCLNDSVLKSIKN